MLLYRESRQCASLKPQYVPTKLHGLQHASWLKQNCSLYPDVHDRNLYPEISGGVPQALLANATVVDYVWNVMAQARVPDFVFWRNGCVHLNRRGCQFSWLLSGELCTSACRVCNARASLCSAVMWRLLVNHSILLFPLHFSALRPVCHHISNAVYHIMSTLTT
jgi:hypothetical protein